MSLYHSLSHPKWSCTYHLVFITKHRQQLIYGKIRQNLEKMFHEEARQKECRIVEGHLMKDHVHMCIEIPSKYNVASVVGFIQGKSAIAIARKYRRKEKNSTGEHFWARGYALSFNSGIRS